MKGWRLGLLLASACMSQAADAAWLNLCSLEPATKEGLLHEYTSVSGAWTGLLLRAAPIADCATSELPLPVASITAGRLLSADLGRALAPGFALTGSEVDHRFQLEEVIPRGEPAGSSQIPAGVELIDDLTIVHFGAENRTHALHKDGRLALTCSAGKAPAGIILKLPHRGLPLAISLDAQLSYAADGEFELALSDRRRAAGGDPLPLAQLPADQTTAVMQLPRAGLDIASIESFTLACPSRAARLALHSLKLVPSSTSSPIPARALWAWQPAAWLEEPEALLTKLDQAGADTLFTTIPIDLQTGRVSQAAPLENFVKLAGKRGVRVWAVVGDPGAVKEDQRAGFARFPAAYALYNSEVNAEARLAGLQFDIEPYINAGYSLAPSAWQEAYLETLAQLKRATSMPMDVVVPYWWADQQNGRLLERLAPVTDSLTVMNYRTHPAQIKRFAQPFLEWGQRHGRAVRIALESGPIADELQRHYAPKPAGEVAIISIGTKQALLLFDRPLTAPNAWGEVRMFAYTHTTPLPGGAVSFAGQRQALLTLLPELENLWRAWPGFSGVALHEFEP